MHFVFPLALFFKIVQRSCSMFFRSVSHLNFCSTYVCWSTNDLHWVVLWTRTCLTFDPIHRIDRSRNQTSIFEHWQPRRRDFISALYFQFSLFWATRSEASLLLFILLISFAVNLPHSASLWQDKLASRWCSRYVPQARLPSSASTPRPGWRRHCSSLLISHPEGSSLAQPWIYSLEISCTACKYWYANLHADVKRPKAVMWKSRKLITFSGKENLTKVDWYYRIGKRLYPKLW